MNRNKTGFERFASKFLILSFAIFVVGTIVTKSIEYSYSIECQSLEKEIQTIESTIDGLTMQKQDLVSFERLADVTAKKGYTYKSDAVVTNYQAGQE